MADIKVFYGGFDAGCDIATALTGLQMDTGLDTAILISLMTDRRAEEADDFEGDPRGWWGDAIAVNDDRPVPLGSRLWLLAREKQLPAVMRKAEAYARQALQWLIDDGIAASVSVAASSPQRGWLWLDILVDNTPYQIRMNQ